MRLALSFCLMAPVSAFVLDPPPPHHALLLPPRDQENPRIIEFESESEWPFDAAGHAWTIPKNPPIALKEWDGLKWITHELPTGTNSRQIDCVMADAQDRIWVMPGSDQQPTNFFDSHSGQWRSFPTAMAAFLALKDNPPQFLHDKRYFYNPQYSADHKRIAYRSKNWQVVYYDGTKWQNWKRFEIIAQNYPNMGGSNWDKWSHSLSMEQAYGFTLGPPWFAVNGKLCVNISRDNFRDTWQMDDAGNWSKIAFKSRYPNDVWGEGQNHEEHPAPPDGCVTNQPDSIVVDNLGVTWLTWQGGLYKCIPGFCVPVFGPDEINPFRSKRMLREAFVDSQGNAFLQTADATMDWFIIRPKSPAPVTHIVMKRKDEDSFVARLDARTKLRVTFRWQLDDGPWQLIKANSLALDHLPNGQHVLNITAIDDQLNMDAVPATAKFETKIDPNRQMALLVAQLSERDFSKREVAVEALARQPVTALPVLRKARETATDDQRWWIDAAIQECERQAVSAPKK